MGNGIWLSDHFTGDEFRCGQKGGCDHCGGKLIEIDDTLLRLLEVFRRLMGNRPINVSSGYRCPERLSNPTSQHCLGKAADIWIAGYSWQEMLKGAKSVRFPGIGIYPAIGDNGKHDFIHVDTGLKRSWGRWEGDYYSLDHVARLARAAIR